ncbi:alcohol dehydrogenase [Phyllosticta citriasiana]|uniref:Alcohol dehydrogenase n=1 Tax=Phyllosticta citriasiana TaxID=595635 RepID=A0ABR1KLG1_9PEZI
MASTNTTNTTATTPSIRAWTYTTGGYPSCLQLSNIPAPHLPPPGASEKGTKLLIRVTAASLNPVDIQLMNLPLFTPSALPFPLSTLFSRWPLDAPAQRVKGVGADYAGVVVAAQDGCGFSVGDKVFGLAFTPGGARGTLSEAMLLDAKSDVVLRTPQGWGDVQAASVPLVALTARTCVERCIGYVDGVDADKNDKNKTLVVLGGASATGLYTTLLAAHRGWRVVATCSAAKAALVQGMGAARTIDYTAFSSGAALRAAVAATKPVAIVDCVGGTDMLGIEGVRRYVTIVGDKTARSAMGGAATYLWYPRMAARALVSSYLAADGWMRRTVAGWTGMGREAYACVNLETRGEWLEEFVRVVEAAAAKRGDGKGVEDKIVVDSVYGFEDVKAAFERLDTGRCRGKVVVTVP